MKLFPAVTSVLAMLVGTGCLGAEENEGADPSVSEGELREQTLQLVGTDALTLKDTPALASGATEPMACGARFVQGGRERITCTRGSETVEVILDAAERKAVVLHRPRGQATDQRTFFVCTTSGNGPGALPKKLACSKKAPTTASGHGGLASPFASTVPGIEIPNAHEVGAGGLFLRGMAPRNEGDYDALLGAGVGAVLVFKNQTGTGHDVADEMALLRDRGLAAAQVKNIPFQWKDLGSFRQTCGQVVEGLAFLEENAAAGRKTFFHCTVGEDRTGLLAAVHRLLREPGLEARAAWDAEMCERGYGAGNPLKPAFVKGQLAGGLTPLYRKLAWMAKSGRLTAGALDASACDTDPEGDASFDGAAIPLADLSCGTSTRFQP